MAKQTTGRIEGAPTGLECRAGTYYYRRMFNGKEKRVSLKTRNFAVAVKMVLEINERIDDKGVTPSLAINRDSMTVADAARIYIESRSLRPKSKIRYAGIIANLNEGLEAITGRPETKLTELNRNLISEYAQYRKAAQISPNGHANTPKRAGVSPKTLTVEIGFIKALLKFAVLREWLLAIPNLDGIAPKKKASGKNSEVAKPLSEEELKKVLIAAEEYDHEYRGAQPYQTFFSDLIKLYVYAGLRHEEGKFLEWSDIDFNLDVLKVKAKQIVCRRVLPLSETDWQFIAPHINPDKNKPAFKNDPALLRKIGRKIDIVAVDKILSIKGKDFDAVKHILNYVEAFRWQPKASEGEVPLHPRLKDRLLSLEMMKASNFIFPSVDGGYWRLHFLWHFQRILCRAGVEIRRVHDLRHTTGTMLRRAGVGLETIKELLRHQDISETMIYARYSQEEGRKAVNKLPDL